MSLAKPTEIDEALEGKQRFKGFVNDAPNALNIVNKRIDNEIARATGVENQLREDLTAETERATGVENQLRADLTAETSARTEADTTETQARTAADAQLSGDIEELGNTINGQIQSINTDLTALEARVAALEQAGTGGNE